MWLCGKLAGILRSILEQVDLPLDINKLRSETPGCAGKIHLNNAGAGLMTAQVMQVAKDYIDLEGSIGGYEAQAASQDAIQLAYQRVATLLNTKTRNIAFTENATAAFAQALSSIPFRKGDVVITTRNDYSSNQIQFLSLKKRFGIEVLRAPDSENGGVDVSAMSDLIREKKPKLVCVTQVPTNSGLVQDVAAIGAVCRGTETLYLVDACQSVGQMPVDAVAIGCDFLSATSRKFLRGPRGCGFLYVSDRVLSEGYEPLFIDMHGANWASVDEYEPFDTASRFENWEFNWGLVLGTGAAADYATNIGLELIAERVSMLSEKLRSLLEGIDAVRVLHRGDNLCGIVTCTVDGFDPAEIVATLRAQNINTSSQGRVYAVIDYDDLGVESSLRISPHYYNTEEEIDRVVSALQDITGK